MSDVMDHYLSQTIRQADISDPDELHERLAEIHSDSPQKAALAKLHLNEAYAALAKLAGLGHRLKISLDDNQPTVQYPKMLYKGAGQTITVESSVDEQTLLADGWRDHPDASLATKVVQPAEVLPEVPEVPAVPPREPNSLTGAVSYLNQSEQTKFDNQPDQAQQNEEQADQADQT